MRPTFFASVLLTGICLTACGPGDNSSTTETATAGESSTTQLTGGETSTTGPETTAGSGTTQTATESATESSTGTSEPTSETTGETTGPDSETADSSTTEDVVPCTQDPLPPDGSLCANENEVCAIGCTDACAFCDLRVCMDGVWTEIDPTPGECLTCEEVCPFVLEAACPGGPPDLETCIAGCYENMETCTGLFSQMLYCIGEQPEFGCDAMERPVVEACASEFEELYACIP